MNVMILGSGGREHTIAWKLAQSPLLEKLFISPGNGGTSAVGSNVPIPADDFEGIREFVLANGIEMVVVGPEAPLVKGIVNYFKADPTLSDVKVIGPSEQGARLEGSKQFANAFMERHGIPTASSMNVNSENLEDGFKYLDQLSPPYVLKADGLAAGKGVLIINERDKAAKELEAMVRGKFGEASKTVVIEEFLDGIEASVFVLTDGTSYKIFPEAKDYKRIGENDSGPNTGGMGAVSPVPFANREFLERVEKKIINPAIEGLKEEEIDYKGFLYVGLMNVKGDPYVVEFNVRLGDPETQVVIPRLKSDLLELLEATANGDLEKTTIEIDSRTICTVVMASGGYPGSYEKGKVIKNLDQTADCLVFHSGTQETNGHIITSGGRVLTITAVGSNMEEALRNCYHNTDIIDFEGKYFRRDIGFDL